MDDGKCPENQIKLENIWIDLIRGIYAPYKVMQMGDCNTPSTFQWLMTAIFQNCISQFVHVYLDNIFIYLHSIEDHEKHLGIVFQRLRVKGAYMPLIRSIQIFSNFILILWTFSIIHLCIHSFATSMNFIWFSTILFHLLLSTIITSTWGDTFHFDSVWRRIC